MDKWPACGSFLKNRNISCGVWRLRVGFCSLDVFRKCFCIWSFFDFVAAPSAFGMAATAPLGAIHGSVPAPPPLTGMASRSVPYAALLGGANAPPSYARVASRAMPSRPSAPRVWEELHTVAFKPRECHVPQGQLTVKNLRSAVIAELNRRRVLYQVDCLQVLRDKTVKVVFKDAGSSQSFFDRGLSLNGVNIELKAPFKPTTRVIVQDVPYHMPSHLVRNAFSAFGEVKNVSFRKETDALKSGDRIVSMEIRQTIPRHLVVGGYYATVFYSGQPPYCEICRGEHLTSRCPLKGKCRRCREVGHLGRNCPQREGCAQCGENGHVRLDCPTLVECRHCGNLGHMPEQCPTVVVLRSSQSESGEVNVEDDFLEVDEPAVVVGSALAPSVSACSPSVDDPLGGSRPAVGVGSAVAPSVPAGQVEQTEVISDPSGITEPVGGVGSAAAPSVPTGDDFSDDLTELLDSVCAAGDVSCVAAPGVPGANPFGSVITDCVAPSVIELMAVDEAPIVVGPPPFALIGSAAPSVGPQVIPPSGEEIIPSSIVEPPSVFATPEFFPVGTPLPSPVKTPPPVKCSKFVKNNKEDKGEKIKRVSKDTPIRISKKEKEKKEK